MDCDYHFSEWAFLARTDPAAFERRRKACIEQFLRESGHRRARLEALQATIDAECALAGNPRDAMLAVSRMMCNSLAELHLAMTTLSGEFKNLRRLQAQVPSTPAKPAAAGGPTVAFVNRRRVAGPAPRRGLST